MPRRRRPRLLDALRASGHAVRCFHAHEPDALEAAGWSEVLEEALTGEIAFAGGHAAPSPTPAMTLFDVDGPARRAALAVAAATAAAEAIVCPTSEDRSASISPPLRARPSASR